MEKETTSTIFRTKAEPASEEKLPVGKESPITPRSDEPDLPYTAKEDSSPKPFIAEYFDLGNMWDDRQGGFEKEIGTIGEHIRRRIQSGDLANSTSAVKEYVKKLEKFLGTEKEERSVMRIETLAAHVEFLDKTENIKYKLARYGKYGSRL